MVIERERLPNEMDGLRFYSDETNQLELYERWFHCTDLGKQLKPVIDGYFASEACKTRVPTTDSVQEAPFEVDSVISVDKPQLLSDMLSKLNGDGKLALFDKGEFKVNAYGSFNTPNTTRNIEV